MNYTKLNNLVGWFVFLIATAVYFITLEDTASLWDCGEYITAAYKLEVGHPPGAPLFMILGRLFSFFAAPEEVAIWINRLSALSSSFTILFMFWSISMLAKKILQRKSRDWSKSDQIAALGAGAIGALAYAFSDSFWFSAVEGEVYAMSSLFTAIIFWAILKWDHEMTAIKAGELSKDVRPMRWMILIMFLFGLAIGVHLLGLLVVPAIAFVMYFQMWEKTTLKGIILTGLISVAALGFIQEGIIPGLVAMASGFEVTFVNSMGMPFYTGTIFFFILLILAVLWGIRYTIRKQKVLLNTIIWSFVVLVIGYGSFAVIVIRSQANTPLDENDPENLVTLHAYLKREQYGSWPILNGPYWNSKEAPRETWGDLSPFFLRRFVVQVGGNDLKAFKSESQATAYAKSKGAQYTVVEKYFSSNEKVRHNNVPKYDQSTFLPRMYYTSANPEDAKIIAYKNWSGYDPAEPGTEIGTDGLRLPTFGENLTYFGAYQINWMYWRYFMWNFAGRQNDIQGHGDEMRGNWKSGFAFIDNGRIGDQSIAPSFTKENPANNTFWMLPLILGVIGLIYHIYRAPKDAFVVFLTFFFTGLAIVLYLNQKPFEPRERDYAYAASFYAFAMWIGLGVLALYEAYKNFGKEEWKGFGVATLGTTAFVVFLAFFGGTVTLKAWFVILVIGAIFMGIAWALRKVISSPNVGAVVLTLLTGVVPYIMAEQGWDDHDRSEKTSAQDLAYNYLVSCAPNSILFTAGDNDTFPLWYLQEVEGKFTDIRVCNTSLFDTDWYTEQMMMKQYESEPLPISFREDQILMYAGGTDQVLFASGVELANGGVNATELNRLFELKKKNNLPQFNAAYSQFQRALMGMAEGLNASDPGLNERLNQIKASFAVSADSANATVVEAMTNGVMEIFDGYQNGIITGNQQQLEAVQQQLFEWEKSWSYLPIDEAMKFIKNDDNMLTSQGNQYRAFPCSGFIVKVNKDNAVKSGIVTAKEKGQLEDEIRFSFENRAITRSDLMILDMMNNNEWKRAMYFSSPGGTEVSMALYKAGFLRQNGMAWEISPIESNPNQPFDAEVMYTNLMTKYKYGKMNDADVLTDYYARRQTTQYRSQFGQLAGYYVAMAEQEKANVNNFTPAIKGLRAAGQKERADSLQNVIEGADGRIADYKKRAVNLIKRSLEVMPAEIVIDYGEQAGKTRGLQGADGAQYYMYSDGNLHEYVTLLYRAGAKTEAEKLGAVVANQLESTISYFTESEASIAGHNYTDFAAAVAGYLQMRQIAVDKQLGNPSGAFAARLEKFSGELYGNKLVALYKSLEQMARENGEVGRGNGYYSGQLVNLQGNLDALGVYMGVLAAADQGQLPEGPGNMPDMPSEAILNDSDLMAPVMDETAAVRN